MTDTPALKTFILEDPEGSAAALRAWGGPKARLVVRTADGKEVTLLSGSGNVTIEPCKGIELRIVTSDRSSHALRTVMDAGTELTVGVESQALLIGNLRVGLWHADAKPSSCAEAVAIGSLPSGLPSELEVLAVLHASQLDDLRPLEGLPSLRHLDITNAPNLSDLSGLAGLTGLTSLNLSWCKQVSDLSVLPALTALNSLSLSSCYEVSDLSALTGLEALNSLNLQFCGQVSNLSPLAGLTALTSLDLEQCGRVSDLSALAGLTALTSLNLQYCGQVSDLSPLAGLTALTSLDLSWCDQLSDLSALAGLTALTSLDVSGCKQLSDLSALAGLTALTSLDLSWCDQLSDLSALAGLTALTSLNLQGCDQLSDLSALAGLTALTSLNLQGCDQLSDLSALAGLTALTSLDLSRCDQLSDLSALAGLTALTSLNLSGCQQVSDLSALAGLTALTSLNLSRCDKLSDLSTLAGLTALTSLDLSRCDKLSDLSTLAGLTALTSLNLSGCQPVSDLSALAGLTALKSLNLSGCAQISDLSPLGGLTALTSLDLSRCDQVSNLSTLAGLTALTSLDLSRCDQVSNLSALAGLTALKSLNLSGCAQISDLSPLGGLTALTSLNLKECRRINELRHLRALKQLTGLGLTICPEITIVAPLLGCEQLTKLHLNGSGNIRDLDALSELTSLRELTWTETAAPMAVLAATAVRRGDVDAVEASAAAWLNAVRLSKIPDTFGFRLVQAFGLGLGAPWAAEALAGLARALRERARGDENPALVSAHTWEAWSNEALKLRPEDRRTALEAALSELLAPREVAPVLTPVLTALSTLGPAQGPSGAPSAAPDLTGLSDLLAWVRTEVLAPLTAVPEHARLAAPAAAVLLAGFGLDAEVRAWLDRGTVPEAPHWRDRVLSALVARASRVADVHDARRWMAQIQSPEALDQCRAALAQALAARLPTEAAAELDAIGDDALRTRIALTLRAEPTLLATPADLYALVLARQNQADAPGEVLSTLVSAHPDSPLVAALVADLSPPAAPAPAGPDLATLTGHAAWTEEVAGRRWSAFATSLPALRHLAVEAIAARAVGAGLLEADLAPSLVDRVANA
jgi:Leucine-rich repeat (LRR) protein